MLENRQIFIILYTEYKVSNFNKYIINKFFNFLILKGQQRCDFTCRMHAESCRNNKICYSTIYSWHKKWFHESL